MTKRKFVPVGVRIISTVFMPPNRPLKKPMPTVWRVRNSTRR
jgi:hypothetical protein